MDMQDRIEQRDREIVRLNAYIERLKAENVEVLEEAVELRADKAALVALVAELRERREGGEPAEVRQVSNSPDLPTDDSGAST